MSASSRNGSGGAQSMHQRAGVGFGGVRTAILLLARAAFVPLASAAPITFFREHGHGDEGEDTPDAGDPDLYVNLAIATFLVLLGGVFAGLTIALMGQDETYLQVIATSGEGAEKRHAARVLGLLKKGKHWVLVTLLLSNVITNETLPIVLDRALGGGWQAVMTSTVLIVIFGEIVPQSICVRYGLSIGAFMSPMVLMLMWVMCIVAWPTAKLLDYLLGEDHGTMYKKAGLKTLVQLHKTLGTTPADRLMEDEVTIINSVLDLKEKPVGNIMTPMQDVFTMSADTVLDERMMDIILSQGYSRIPIYLPHNSKDFIGMLLVKILITYDPEDAKRVRDFALATLPETAPDTSCLDIINFFQEGKSHMVLVSDFPGQDKGALGVVTLEDVIEELIGEEIIDESDVFIDVHKAIRRLAPAPKQRVTLNGKPASFHEWHQSDSEREATQNEDEPLLGRRDSARDSSKRPPSVTNPSTTFLMRRRSSATSDSGRDAARKDALPVRTDATDIRQHLKHLGPSNMASKPKPTRFASVKIKPGVDTIPEAQGSTQTKQPSSDISESSIPPPAAGPEGGEGAGLLKSAGKDASDGAAALRAGYGTLDHNDDSFKPGSYKDDLTANEASKIAFAHSAHGTNGATGDHQNDSYFAASRSSSKSKRPSTSSKQHSNSNYLDLPDKFVVGSNSGGDESPSNETSRERSKSRRAVRSGSITETMIEVGGMRKVVIGTTSSTSEDDDEDGDGKSARKLVVVSEEDGTEEGARATSGSAQNEGGSNGAGNKKKKKRRKGKKSSSDE